MTDAEFLQALECCRLPPGAFGHGAHVRAGYLYLRQADFALALERLRRTLRNFAAHHGNPERYHETVTVACLALIQEHIGERGDGGGWEAFARDNQQLLDRDLLRPYYAPAQLETALARKVFVLPRPPSLLPGARRLVPPDA